MKHLVYIDDQVFTNKVYNMFFFRCLNSTNEMYPQISHNPLDNSSIHVLLNV